MKNTIAYQDIVMLDPCYDPMEIGMPTDYEATIPEFIDEYRDRVKHASDIIWLLCRNDYMTDKDMRLFAVWCAREALKLVENPDKRSVEGCNVAEKYANGEATTEELRAAWGAAWDAAWDAAGSATRATAVDAAEDAARYAAGAAIGAARDASRGAAEAAIGAARDASRGAAEDAARYAARYAAGAAIGAARDASRGAAEAAQIDKLKTFFK